MTATRCFIRSRILAVGMLALTSGPLALADAPPSAVAAKLAIPTTSPEAQGFATAGLREFSEQTHALVNEQKLAGITTLISRHGKVVHFDTYGKASAATGKQLQPDSIFRIASMTKPITGVAMMQLYEQGKWRLDDPVSKHIPQFAKLQVRKAGGGTEPQRSPMTMAQLMSHSAGFGVSSAYSDANLAASDLQGMIDKLQALPLATQPGTAWDYGPSVNIQGYIVEKLSGQTLDVYFSEHIFKPLGMVDTGFWVPPAKADRVVAVHVYDAQGKIATQPDGKVTTAKPQFLAGSGGLMSTAKDYWLFAQALANGGELGGKRILKSQTVELMRTNVLAPGVEVDTYGPSLKGVGFGMDFAVVMDPRAANTPQGVNTFYWGGAYGTWFWIDPTNDLIVIGMIQNLNGSTPGTGTPPLRNLSTAAIYQALTNPAK